MQPNSPARTGFAGSAWNDQSVSPHLRLPLARLLQVLMVLQSERFPNVRRLAEICGVSRRTIYRDLTTLETAGLSIVYQPDRQGYQLGGECLLQPPQLDDQEALAILVMSRLGSIPDPLGSLLPAGRALTKVIQSLPAALRNRIANSGELIEGAGPAGEIPAERRAIYETILSAVLHRRRLRLWYREEEPSPVTTTLDLYRMARIQGQWALVGHSSADDRVMLYWLPWLEHVEATGETYAIPPRFRLERFLQKSQPQPRACLKEVRLRFSAAVSRVVRDMPGQNGTKQTPGPDGTLDLLLMVESPGEIVSWVLGFGDQVEVIEPQELRKAIREWAEKITRRHLADSP